jgi:dolichol-phosphate mannosyltransferase
MYKGDFMNEAALVIIPTYNEKENITAIIAKVYEQGDQFSVLVVDDGSPDGTGAIVKDLMKNYPERLFILERSGKQGLGSAYVAGFRWALEREYEYIFEMDADFSHSPDMLPKFIAQAQSADLVLGCRYKDGRISVVNWDWKRLLLSYGANLYTRIVTGMKIADATGGFKCFRRRALQALDFNTISSDGYCFQIETTYYLHKLGYTIAEIPIVFTDRTLGTSKMSGGIISEALFVVFRLRFTKVKGVNNTPIVENP